MFTLLIVAIASASAGPVLYTTDNDLNPHQKQFVERRMIRSVDDGGYRSHTYQQQSYWVYSETESIIEAITVLQDAKNQKQVWEARSHTHAQPHAA